MVKWQRLDGIKWRWLKGVRLGICARLNSNQEVPLSNTKCPSNSNPPFRIYFTVISFLNSYRTAHFKQRVGKLYNTNNQNSAKFMHCDARTQPEHIEQPFQSLDSDRLAFTIWCNNGYQTLEKLYGTINEKSGSTSPIFINIKLSFLQKLFQNY